MQKGNIQWKSKQITKMIENKSLIFNNPIQRGYVWDKKQSSKLIDTIFREYPVPAIFVIKTDDKIATPKGDVSVYDVIDGKQRCLTISRFMNDEFALTTLDAFEDDNNNMVDLSGLKYSELPDYFKDQIDNFSLTCYFFIDATEAEVVEMMNRLNNGKPLGTIEKTRIKAKDLQGIRELAGHPFLVNNLSENALNRYHNEDIIVKMAVLLKSTDNCVALEKLNSVYETLDFKSDTDLAKKIQTILDCFESVHEYLVADSKKIAKKICNKTHMLSCVKLIDRAMNDGLTDLQIAQFFETFFDGTPTMSEEYNNAVKEGTNHALNVSVRLDSINKELDWFLGNDAGVEPVEITESED